eukprot:jgi/Botrbrau1/19454/Bobra.0338s0074.1
MARQILNMIAPELKPEEAVAPISRLPGLPLPSLIPVPNLTRLYFRFLEPVDAGRLTDTTEEMVAAYALIRNRVEEGLQHLLLQQGKDPQRDFLPRLWNLGASFFPDLAISDGKNNS